VVEGWVRKHGLMGSLYVDRDSIYRCEGVASIAGATGWKAAADAVWAGDGGLGVDLILQTAHKPRAGGTDERRAARRGWSKKCGWPGSATLKAQTGFWTGSNLRQFNRQFARAAASPVDVHRGVPRNLNEVLSWEEDRVVQGDWTVACAGKRYQLDRNMKL